MYLVLFDEDIIETFPMEGKITVKDNDVTWSTGRMTGIQTPFIIVDQEPTSITDDVLVADRKSEFEKDEVTTLKERLADTETALITLMDMWGGV